MFVGRMAKASGYRLQNSVELNKIYTNDIRIVFCDYLEIEIFHMIFLLLCCGG